MKTCVCFYGLVQRSLEHTIDNIRNNILYDNPDVYIHTFDTTVAQAIRAGEPPTPVNPNDILKLNPTKYVIESEENFNSTFDFEKYEKLGDPFKGDPGGFQTLHNLLRELHSIQQVWKLVDKTIEYDRVIMTRADLSYDRRLDFDVHPATIYTCNRTAHTTYHNDFMAMGTMESLSLWANRLDYAEEFGNANNKYNLTRFRGVHPESFVTHIIDKSMLNDASIPVTAKRVRANGKIQE